MTTGKSSAQSCTAWKPPEKCMSAGVLCPCWPINRGQSFSNFMEMHPILSTYRVGNITLKIVELEVQRAQHR